MSLRRLRPLFASATLIPLAGCGYFDAREAHRAQFEMVGMTGFDLQACAGVPGSTKKLNDTTEIWQYDVTKTLKSIPDSSIIPVQSVVGIYEATFGGAGSSCRMIVRMDHDRVSEIHYSGNSDEYIGLDGICSMITRGCARQRESTMHHAKGGVFGPISAFHSPATPPQNASATYSDQSGKYVPIFSKDKTKPVIRPAPPPEPPKPAAPATQP